MAKTFKRVLSGVLALIMCMSIWSWANGSQSTLNIVGEQYLTKNAYIFTSQ